MFEVFLYIYFVVTMFLWLLKAVPKIVAEIKKAVSMAKSALKIKEAMKPVPFVPLTEEETLNIQREVRKLRREVDVLNIDLARSKTQAKTTFDALMEVKKRAKENGVEHLFGLY